MLQLLVDHITVLSYRPSSVVVGRSVTYSEPCKNGSRKRDAVCIEERYEPNTVLWAIPYTTTI